ncbi:hypothetical protein LguiA_004178 [Lonicera macranthoides]
MAFALRRALPLLVIAFLLVYEDRVSIPSCKVVPEDGHVDEPDHPDDLKVVIVANLLLLGSKAGYFNVFFRNYYLSKFFRKSFEILKPDMMLVLGDVSARGAKLTRNEWSSVLHQFHSLVGPFLTLPFHVTLGDRDIGQCSALNPRTVKLIASSFPGLDSAGCGAFEISNISFVSLNSVALLCGNNKLRFSVEKAVERESIDLRMDSENGTELVNESNGIRASSGDIGWRENAMSSGSGPVLLLHFPLHQTVNSNCWGDNIYKGTSKYSHEEAKTSGNWGLVGTGPYQLSHTLPPNATEYIFQALRPRMIFSAHTHKFCDHTHSDGTREITVPAMSWAARDDPAFMVATFRRNGRAVTLSHCTLARESHVLFASISVLLVFLLSLLVRKTSPRTNSGS